MMVGIATKGQLRMSYLRWALVIVPVILVLGWFSGVVAGSGDTAWYRALEKPSFQPPSYLFGIVWPILYVMMGLALAMIIHARGSRWRGPAIGLFVVQLLFNFTWSPLFFGMNQVSMALIWILITLALVIATTWVFWRIRRTAGLLLVPYIAWLTFATALNYQIDRMNPDAETLVVGAASTQI